MCTVTYIPTKEGCFLTSSRDENILRQQALKPAVYEHDGMNVVYPKDAKANGSWIAFTEGGNAAVLLNGGFAKHIPEPPYRKSRGLIFLDIISHPQPVFCFMGISLNDIEPFTLVLFVNGLLFEAIWDGKQKHFSQLDESTNYIWSSVTLYEQTVINKRKQWFQTWLEENTQHHSETIVDFHRFAGEGDILNSVLMNRNNEMLTVSITSVHIQHNKATMKYFDIKENTLVSTSLHLKTIAV